MLSKRFHREKQLYELTKIHEVFLQSFFKENNVIQNTSQITKKNKLIIAFLLIVVVMAVFIRTTSYQFVNLDDSDYVTQNNHVTNGITQENIVWALTTFHAANWHPVTWISHMIDCQFFGLNPWGHHLTNVLLHAANTILLFLLLSRLTGTLWRSAFVAALFAIHPLHVESVAWVSERKDVLSTMFLLITLASYANYAQHRKLKYYVLAVVMFSFGLMTKPMLVTVPFLLLLVDYWPLGRFTEQNASAVDSNVEEVLTKSCPIRLLLYEKLPFLVLTAASCIITVLAQSSLAVISLEELPFSIRISNALVAYTSYIGKTLWPMNLGAYYPFPSAIPFWKVAGSILLLASISILTLNKIRRYPYLGVGWFWYIVTLVPVIGLVQVGAQSMADRYTYVPLIGLFIAIVWGGFDLVAIIPGRRLILATTSSILILTLSIISYRQAGYWRDSETLFRHTIEVTKDNWFAHTFFGVALDVKGQHDTALPHLVEAVRLNPRFSKSRFSLGVALRRLGRIDEAIVHYRAAIQLEPDFAAARNNLASALVAKGNVDEAIDLLLPLVKMQPNDAMYRSNLANALDKKGHLDEAVVQYLEALRIAPGSASAHNNLGSIYYRMGRLEDAEFHLSNAIRLDPSLAASTQFYLNYINARRSSLPEPL